MAQEDARVRALRVVRGTLAASAFTLVSMAVLAALVIYAGLREESLMALNQIVKLAAVVLGTAFAVGLGGEKGLITGALVGMLYILVGYGFYSLIDGSAAAPAVIAVEEAAGALAGGIAGVIFANARPARKRV